MEKGKLKRFELSDQTAVPQEASLRPLSGLQPNMQELVIHVSNIHMYQTQGSVMGRKKKKKENPHPHTTPPPQTIMVSAYIAHWPVGQ